MAQAPKTLHTQAFLKPLLPGPDARVSVGVPVRNGGAFIEAALSSVVAQTHAELDIVISDNASSDNTAAICQRFAEADSRIRYFRQSVPLTANANFRFVLDQCQSDWFMWASHDDLRALN